MNELVVALDRVVPLQGPLGYLNFSEGRPDARFQRQLSDAYGFLSEHGAAQPWQALHEALRQRLEALHAEGGSAFRDAEQARAVLDLSFLKLLPAYREFHGDLLAHCSDADLFQPFFLARVCEAVLAQRGPWEEESRIVGGALRQLNDYVGHRPVATLETRPRGEPYEHERFRPVPLYVKGADFAWGPYRELIQQALAILGATDPEILQDACFEPAALDELALDVRAYDFDHPADKRPNYCFGEWDPHLIDNQGRYRRYVVRRIVLDALLEDVGYAARVPDPEGKRAACPTEERVWEAAAVLAGTILMGAGVSGAGPTTHDSTVTLSTLVPRIARCREAFYGNLLQGLTGEHRARLEEEARRTRQPFGGIRQRLNLFMARQKALQLQQRHLALLFAEIGDADASRRQAAKIPVVSTRLLTEMHLRFSGGQQLLDQGDVVSAAGLLPEIEDLLHRGIACGALVDPWNILGFQGQYPRFTALEDSVRDHRIEALIGVVGGLFSLHARVLSEGAATGKLPLNGSQGEGNLLGKMRRLAEWWDQFATMDVSDVPKVHGGQAVESAEGVAGALARWRERGEATADLAFWRERLEGFHSPKAFALVVEALLRKEDFRAAMALLMTWLGQRDEVALLQDEHSFYTLALRWMLAVCLASRRTDFQAVPLIAKFFDYLEANAEDLWDMPQLGKLPGADDTPSTPSDAEDDESPYGAAYEGMTYKDSTDDNVEAEVLDIMPQRDFDLAAEADRLESHLRFLTTLARLWNIATRGALAPSPADRAAALPADVQETLAAWLARARHNLDGLSRLLDTLHEHDVPKPSGSFESVVEFDRRRLLKERLESETIGTCLETVLAIGAIQGIIGLVPDPLAEAPVGWEAPAVRLEQALWRGDAAAVQRELPEFLAAFRSEPLLYAPLSQGGHPRQILRATLAQVVLQALVLNLPRLGLLRETLDLVRTAKTMEDQQPVQGQRITEFGRLFQLACLALVEAVVDSAAGETAANVNRQTLVGVLETLLEPLLELWIEHSEGMRLSTLEALRSPQEWARLRDFIQRYGGDLFHPRFMALGNLRGILHQGIGAQLDYLSKNADPLHPVKLIEELGDKIERREAEHWLYVILKTVEENYAEYQDYKATTPQSDYGENLHQLLDVLRLKASYDRNAWKLRPLYLAHEALARRMPEVAGAWAEQMKEFTREVADDHRQELDRLEQGHGLRLRTIADRIEERFVKTLEIDRVVALIEPAMPPHPQPLSPAAGARGDHRRPLSPAAGASGETLEESLRPLAEHPTGVGMDVPVWLRRLEAEVQRVRQARTAVANLVGNLMQIPRTPLPWRDVLGMLAQWKEKK